MLLAASGARSKLRRGDKKSRVKEAIEASREPENGQDPKKREIRKEVGAPVGVKGRVLGEKRKVWGDSGDREQGEE